MKSKSTDYEFPSYQYPIEGIAHVGKPGEPAAIFLLDGHWHLAPIDSAAEALLHFAGGLHVATLTFPHTSAIPALN